MHRGLLLVDMATKTTSSNCQEKENDELIEETSLFELFTFIVDNGEQKQ